MKRFFLIAFFAISVAVFFACSTDAGTGGSGLFGEEFQIYLNEYPDKYNGNGTIRVKLCNENSGECDYLDAGAAREGMGNLNLPSNVAEEYLSPPEEDDFPVTITTSPKDAKGATGYLYLISGNKAYSLEQTSKEGSVSYIYFAQATTAKGSGTENDFGYTMEYNLNVNAKRGWNAIYTNCVFPDKDKMIVNCETSTSPSKVNLNDMHWIIQEVGSAAYYGGPESTNASSSSSGANNVSSSSEGAGSGAYCVIHDYETCISDPQYTSNPAYCGYMEGVLMDYCPSSYYNYDTPSSSSGGVVSGDYCVDNYYEECVPIEILNQYEVSCFEWGDEIKSSCPSGYDIYPW